MHPLFLFLMNKKNRYNRSVHIIKITSAWLDSVFPLHFGYTYSLHDNSMYLIASLLAHISIPNDYFNSLKYMTALALTMLLFDHPRITPHLTLTHPPSVHPNSVSLYPPHITVPKSPLCNIHSSLSNSPPLTITSRPPFSVWVFPCGLNAFVLSMTVVAEKNNNIFFFLYKMRTIRTLDVKQNEIMRRLRRVNRVKDYRTGVVCHALSKCYACMGSLRT